MYNDHLSPMKTKKKKKDQKPQCTKILKCMNFFNKKIQMKEVDLLAVAAIFSFNRFCDDTLTAQKPK